MGLRLLAGVLYMIASTLVKHKKLPKTAETAILTASGGCEMFDDTMGDGPPMPHSAVDQELQYARLRAAMLRDQLHPRGIVDEQVLVAMGRLPRHRFMPAEVRQFAYDDRAVPIGQGQTISQPYIVAYMTQLLAVQAGERVLEIGTGSGYQAAVLAEMGATVFSIERYANLSARVLHLLAELGYNVSTQIHLSVGDGSLGWPSAAPYDAIIVTAAAPALPEALADQLRVGGRLLIPVGEAKLQTLVLFRKEGGELIAQRMIPCAFVPLVGEQGWAEDAPQLVALRQQLAEYVQQQNNAASAGNVE